MEYYNWLVSIFTVKAMGFIIILHVITPFLLLVLLVPQETKVVQRTNPDGRIQYVIRQRHFAFRWMWVDAWVNSSAGAACEDTFNTMAEAQHHMCYFDGTPAIDRAV